MRFKSLSFTRSVVVFPGDDAYGSLFTYPNQVSKQVDSIDVMGSLVVVRRGDVVRAVPLSSVESGEPILEERGTGGGQQRKAG